MKRDLTIVGELLVLFGMILFAVIALPIYFGGQP